MKKGGLNGRLYCGVITMRRIQQRQRIVHHCASVIGGFWAGYTVLNHIEILANAQTGNLIRLVLGVCAGDFTFVWFMVIGFLLYCAGNVFYVLVRRRVRVSMKIVSLICSAVAVAVVGAIPFVRNDFIACFPIVFVAPIQWNAFKSAGGYSSSTIFSSNNVRQASMQTTRYFLTKDRQTGLKARFYWVTLLSFHLGVALAGVLSLWCGVFSIWFCYLPIALTAVAYYRYMSEKLRVASLVSKR